jgi:hypothetical protein
MNNQIKELRIKIDGLAQLIKELKPIEKSIRRQRGSLPATLKKVNSKEIEKSYDSLTLAKAWLGKMLGELGNELIFKPNEYKIELHSDAPVNMNGNFEVFIDGEKKEVKNTIIVIFSKQPLTYNEILDKFRNTKAIKDIKGNFKNPYGSGYKTIEDIEPTADVSFGQEIFKDNFELLWWKNELNHIEKVDWLRQSIEKIISEIKEIGNPPSPLMLNRELSIARTNAFNHLCEARFWLGFELARIKKK